jgi:glycopeptide antibiotics resistance protein
VNRFRNQRMWQAILAAMLVPLAFVAFWPNPVDQPVQGQLAEILKFLHRNGYPGWINYTLVEAAANTALFIPLGIVSALAFPGTRWWQVGSFGLFLSGCMELGQLLFLHNRFASFLDLATNASGAVIGALLTTLMVDKLQARRLFRQRASKDS